MAQTKEKISRKETIQSELYDLGIYVQDYKLYISKQISESLALLKSSPKLNQYGKELERISLAS